MRFKFNVLIITAVFFCTSSFAQQNYWSKDLSAKTSKGSKASNLDANHFELFKLNLQQFSQSIANTSSRSAKGTSIQKNAFFPDENGLMQEFSLQEVATLSDELATKYPTIKTYLGKSTNGDGTRIRLTVSHLGVNAMITYLNRPSTFLNPKNVGAINDYIVFNKAAKLEEEIPFVCKEIESHLSGEHKHKSEDVYTHESSAHKQNSEQQSLTSHASENNALEGKLVELRIAIAATGEYTKRWSDNVGDRRDDAYAQIVTSVNRLNELYETDLGITFRLISDKSIVFDNPISDPFDSDLNLGADLQELMDATYDSDDYDLGHLYHKDVPNGNAGCIGCVGDNGKASAFSAHSFTGSNFDTDTFDIDYVSHEIGHQLGGHHTWAFAPEGTFNKVQFEPGSGSTIMGYAGITGPDDVQGDSDPYFHYGSIREIKANIGAKVAKFTTFDNPNIAPVVEAGDDYSIPIATPFVLTGAATDENTNDILTYAWEQIDLGVSHADNFSPLKYSGPVFRSHLPTTSNKRYLPNVERVIQNELLESNPILTFDNTSWETLSNFPRSYKFALTVRDRSFDDIASGIGRVSYDSIQVNVIDTDGPFAVKSQASELTMAEGSIHTIKWDVVGTDKAPINVSKVNILLSTDGGYNYDHVLAENVDNDGTHEVFIPVSEAENTTETTNARIKVEAVGNVFYAINQSPLTIEKSDFIFVPDSAINQVCLAEPFKEAVYNFKYIPNDGFSDEVVFDYENRPDGAQIIFDPTSAIEATDVSVIVKLRPSFPTKSYNFDVTATSNIDTSKKYTQNLSLKAYDSEIEPIQLSSPANNTLGVNINTYMTWVTDANVENYFVEVSEDADFTSVVSSGSVSVPPYKAENLVSLETYYWRVSASNECSGTSSVSEVFSFSVQNIACNVFKTDVDPIPIPDRVIEFFIGDHAVTADVGSPQTISEKDAVIIEDLNVTVNIEHTESTDLYIMLVSPYGNRIDLSELLLLNEGDNGANYTNTVFDDDSETIIFDYGPYGPPFTGTFKPIDDLSIVNGLSSEGTWELRVWDPVEYDSGKIIDWSMEICGAAGDFDADTIYDNFDNCYNVINPDQLDFDNDGIGDLCDDDIDNDGVPNELDMCNNSPLNTVVDLRGCAVFDIPVENFVIKTLSETCASNNDGKIVLTSAQAFDFTATLTGPSTTILSKEFTDTLTFDGLDSGEYTLSLTEKNEEGYESRFTINISEPQDFVVIPSIAKNATNLDLELEGGRRYLINLNGHTSMTAGTSISLPLKAGTNHLRVTTDKDCQGVFEETIEIDSYFNVSPNPIPNGQKLRIETNLKEQTEANAFLYSSLGTLVLEAPLKVENGTCTLDVSHLATGVYILNLRTENELRTFKVLKN